MKSSRTELPDVMLLDPDVFEDERGYFMETWSSVRYRALDIPQFVQDNISRSRYGVLRGLHLQHPDGQGKLVQVVRGEVFDVAVDVRVGSPTFGRWVGVVLSDVNKRQIWIPPGFAHGFCVTSEAAFVTYKCTAAYRRECELTVAWNDPALAIAWPIVRPLVSAKDANAPCLGAIPRNRLPGTVSHA